MSPFEVDLGWKPKSAICLLQGDNYSIEFIDESKERMTEEFRKTTFSQEQAKARKSSYRAEAPPYKNSA